MYHGQLTPENRSDERCSQHRDDEARLQALRRRLLALNQRWHTELNVRLSRVDLLDDGKGRLDPTRKAWRTLGSSEFGRAFDRQPPSVAG